MLTCKIELAKRDRAMCADYVGGLTQAEIANKYGLSLSYVGKRLSRRGMTLPMSMRVARIQRAVSQSPYKAGPAGIPAHLRSDYRNIRRTGFTPPEAKKMLGLEA